MDGQVMVVDTVTTVSTSDHLDDLYSNVRLAIFEHNGFPASIGLIAYRFQRFPDKTRYMMGWNYDRDQPRSFASFKWDRRHVENSRDNGRYAALFTAGFTIGVED